MKIYEIWQSDIECYETFGYYKTKELAMKYLPILAQDIINDIVIQNEHEIMQGIISSEFRIVRTDSWYDEAMECMVIEIITSHTKTIYLCISECELIEE